MFTVNELQPAPLTEVVTPAKPEMEDGEFVAEAGLVLEGSNIGDGGPAAISSQPIMVEQPVAVSDNQLMPALPSERISGRPQPSTPEADVVLERPHIGVVPSIPANLVMVEAPGMVVENKLKPVFTNETMISSNPEVPTFTPKAGVVVQGVPVGEGMPPVAPDLSEKMRFGLLLGKGEVSAKPTPFSIEEMRAFSGVCDEVYREMSSKKGSSQQ